MATERFNTLVLRVARRLQEPKVDDAGYLTGTSDRYAAVMVAGYVNHAVREVVLEKFLEHGPAHFPEIMPEMTRVSGALALTNGVLAIPADMMYPLGVVQTPSLQFRRIRGRDISSSAVNNDPTVQGTATEPVYYIEGNELKTQGVTNGNVVLRYVVLHQDIVISVAAAGNGKWYTGADGAFTMATKLLTGTFNSALAATDVGKNIMFRTAAKVYHARISSWTNATTMTVAGSDLPAGDVGAGNILQMLISDISPETTDLQLREHWWQQVEETAVKLGILDARRGLLGRQE